MKKDIILGLLFLVLFFCYHVVELSMHEQTHVQTANNYGCDAKIVYSDFYTSAEVKPYNCNLSTDDVRDMKIIYSIQESYYPYFVYHRTMIFILLLAFYIYLTRNKNNI